ncbi:porin family protein [Larkinella arboricola]|uniref:Outer membrane protein with beta-barrel domain n=1 Tax=Larkinella arboricola TaxID=643671 RepID=A0A327WV95_LARAB|nr:porin family protein [Larkinella arboricola]RAJ95987.1 outer membrane protein with beta-barrel domain [Larkinella arboricola]
MKKQFINLLFSSAVISSLTLLDAAAQTTPRTGIKGGLNASTLYLDNVEDRNERIGFHVGVFTQIPVSSFFAIQPELQYSMKGVSADYNLLGASGRNTFKLNYVELPVLATFKLGNSVDLQAGPYASYLVSSKVASEGDLGSDYRSINRDNFNTFDYGLAGGLNIYFGTVLLGLRYGQGLQPVAKDGAARLVMGKAKNAVGQVSIGFTIK